jgi:antitoxin (DNA-binding transcriptional repressor) of toxin-antitoxin stability system
MKRISMQELERRLAALVAEAERGASFFITRHNRVVAQLVPPAAHSRIGSRFGTGRLEPLLRGPTKGRYLDELTDDRGGGRDPR